MSESGINRFIGTYLQVYVVVGGTDMFPPVKAVHFIFRFWRLALKFRPLVFLARIEACEWRPALH